MGTHAALAVHPGSGRGAAARIAGSVASRLRAEVDRLDVFSAGTPQGLRERITRCRHEGIDALVVLGGDGTAHQAVQCCAGTEVALGVVPAGTGNDFARALGVCASPRAALDAIVAALRSGATRTLDLGRVHRATAPPHPPLPAEGTADTTAAWFGTVLCSGFDAAVNARANRLTWPRGPRRYDVALLAELAALRPRTVVLETHEGTSEPEATLVAVGNTGSYGGGVPICPHARADDGLFDVTVVGRVGRAELLRMLPVLRGGRHVQHPAVQTLRARSLRLSGTDWPAFADGEPLGTLPITVTCVPGALRVLA